MTPKWKIALLPALILLAPACKNQSPDHQTSANGSPSAQSVLAGIPSNARVARAIFYVDIEGDGAKTLIGPFPSVEGKQLQGSIKLEIPGLFSQTSGFEAAGDRLSVDRPGGGRSVLQRGGVCYDVKGAECPESDTEKPGNWWVENMAPVNSQGVFLPATREPRKIVEAAASAQRFGAMELRSANLDEGTYRSLIAAYQSLPASFKFSGPNSAKPDCSFAIEVIAHFQPAPGSTPRQPKFDLVPAKDRFMVSQCDEPPPGMG